MPDSEKNAFQLPQGAQNIQTAQSGVRHSTMDGTAHGEEIELATKLREDGIVDLRNTTDTDGDITWAPGTLLYLPTVSGCNTNFRNPLPTPHRC